MTRFLLASGNKAKRTEMTRILVPLGINLLTPEEIPLALEVEETGTTFAANAYSKALAFHRASGIPTIADDSGLCVDALPGKLGVYSKRYGNEDWPQARKNALLLQELENTPPEERTAYFVCHICCVISTDIILDVEECCYGTIATEPRGAGGFGYDPLFLVEGVSFAELSPEEKDYIGHRGKAMRRFAKELTKALSAL